MHLLRVLASADPFSSQDPKAASDALLAAGAIALEDPVLAQINAAGTDEPHRRRALAYPAKLIWREVCQGENVDLSHLRWVGLVGLWSAGWVAVRQAVRDARSD